LTRQARPSLLAYFDYLATRIQYRHFPKLIERAIATAEKIKASGLPARAYSALNDPLLTAILEATAEEEDPELQKVWENLLAPRSSIGRATRRDPKYTPPWAKPPPPTGPP
jgi:hypothetical protein